MKKLTIFLLTLIINITVVYSQYNPKSCEIPSVISSGEFKLLKSCSPYFAPKSIIVNVGATLTSEPGVEIIMPDSAMITINGNINLVGTDTEPIHFIKAATAKRWLYIYVYKSKDTARFENVIFDDALRAVFSFNSKLLMNKTTGNNVVNYAKVKYGSAKILNSKIYCQEDIGIEIADVIQGIQALMIIDGNYIKCSLKGRKTDAIDIGDFSNCVVKNNIVCGSKLIKNSDCIDCDNCHNILLKNNIVFNAYDKGISLGSTTSGANNSGTAEGNIVYNCSIGIAVNDSANFIINHNTIFNNDTSIYMNNGGQANINNTIIASSRKANIHNSNSNLDIKYSLCDKELFSGTGNIMADPLFSNSAQQDFSLKSISPCIDKGDPSSPLDPDNTRTDIGAIYFNQIKIINLYINEFMAINTSIIADEFNEYDSWLEIYNANNYEIDLGGLYLSDDPAVPLKYQIPLNSNKTKLAAGGYKLIWCDNQTSQGPLHTNFILNQNKVQLSLYQVADGKTILLDSISSGKQQTNNSYCRYPDGNAFSGISLLPTPGSTNILIIDKIHKANPIQSVIVFPNPASDKLSLVLDNIKPCNADISLTNITGEEIISVRYYLSTTGKHNLSIFDSSDKISNLPQGIYLLSISTGYSNVNKKISILKN